ncbi:hypothetical protein ACVWZK_000211 [Bradyrhizobium sp. GM0.4]
MIHALRIVRGAIMRYELTDNQWTAIKSIHSLARI